MKIEHNSRELFYRTPFGAAVKQTPVTMRIALSDFGIPKYVKLHYEFGEKTESVNMSYVFNISNACIYESTLTLPEQTGLFHYYFEVASHDMRCFYSNNDDGLGGIGRIYSEKPYKKYQITVYDKDFTTPLWWQNSICYQIFPDRFFKSDKYDGFLHKTSEVIKRNWGDVPFYKAEQFGGQYLANDFFGGNLAGIEEKLPYLKELGISCIYLNPIFESFSNHRYDTGNYMAIDPMLGTENDFERLCTVAEKLGIKIILDGVFNHTGSDSIYFNKKGTYNSVGAYQSKESSYFDWYHFESFPDKYESWWGIDTLPQTEENSESFQNYILTDDSSVVKKWLKSGACGWRLDVVDELPDFFVEILRREVKKENPDAVIIGEVWEDASNKVAYDVQRRYFMGRELDSVMNYPLRAAMIDLVNMSISSEEFDRRIMSLKENYPKPAFYSLFNFLSGHDTERILTLMGGQYPDSNDERAHAKLSEEEKHSAVLKVKCLIAMQMLLPGVPSIFYGDEAGLEGYGDPFCRKCFPWGQENNDIFEYTKQYIALRSSSVAFMRGEFETVYKIGAGYGFIRYDDDDSFIVLVNPGGNDTFRLDISRFDIHELRGVMHSESYKSDDGIYFIHMPEKSVKVFKNSI